jgi:adenylate cyclase class IV
MIEVEVRSWLHPSMQKNVQEKVSQMRRLRAGASLDTYFDTSEFAFLCHLQMIFFRVREEHFLQIKYDAAGVQRQPPPCIEREFFLDGDQVPDEVHLLMQSLFPAWKAASSWQELLRANRLEEQVRIDKYQRVYQDGPVIVCLDEVARLGHFIEGKINCPEGSAIDEAQAQVDAYLAALGGTSLKAGYVEMWLYYHHHEAYQFIPERFRVEEHLLPIPLWREQAEKAE